MRIINGAEISRQVLAEVTEGVADLREAGVIPGLAVVLVGTDPASEVYVRMKVRACTQVGMMSRQHVLPENVTTDELFALIDLLNEDPDVHGILVQLPLPSHLPYKEVLERVLPEKDVDGFHPLNAGRSFVGDPSGFVPATPAGIMELFRREGIVTEGKNTVIVGRSLIVSKPLASLLMAPGANATVTVTHRFTADLAWHTRNADILIVAVGRAGMITADMVKPGAVIIDVGTNRVGDTTVPTGYRIVGDVDFEGVSGIVSAITPVPGGVGPMTIAMLLSNTLEAARRFAALRS